MKYLDKVVTVRRILRQKDLHLIFFYFLAINNDIFGCHVFHFRLIKLIFFQLFFQMRQFFFGFRLNHELAVASGCWLANRTALLFQYYVRLSLSVFLFVCQSFCLFQSLSVMRLSFKRCCCQNRVRSKKSKNPFQ